MLILGIDPGLETTGYGIIQNKDKKLVFVDAGYIKTKNTHTLTERLQKIYTEVSSLFKSFAIESTVLEKLYAHYKHPVTACLLGHARGVICLASIEHKVPLFEYGATRIKKVTVGKGHAPKDQIQQMVFHTLGLRAKKELPYDVTDALSLAIAHCYIVHHGQITLPESS